MNFKMPKIDIPDLTNTYNPDEIFARLTASNINNLFPDIPKIEDVDFNSKISEAKSYVNNNHPEWASKLQEVKGMIPDMNSYIPDMNSYIPDMSIDMAGLDIPKIESVGIEVPSFSDMGIDTSELESMGIDTSSLDFNTSDFTSEIDSFDMSEYSSDIDISSEIEMPDMSPQGIMKSMIGVEDPTDINGIIKYKMENSEPKNVSSTILSIVDSIAYKKVPKYKYIKSVANYADISDLDFSSVDAVLSNDYWGVTKGAIRGYVDHKVNTVRKIGSEISEFYSFVDKNQLDLSSMDAIKSNDYFSIGKNALNGYLNSKLDKLDETIDSKFNEAMSFSDMDMEMNDNSLSEYNIDINRSDFEIDMSELESMGIDTSQFTMPDMNFEMPEINSQTFDIQNPIDSIDMSQFNMDSSEITKPIRDMVNKYLS